MTLISPTNIRKAYDYIFSTSQAFVKWRDLELFSSRKKYQLNIAEI